MAANVCTILKEALAIPGKNPKFIFRLFLISFLVDFLFSYAAQQQSHSLSAGLAQAASIKSLVIAQLVLNIIIAAVTTVLSAISIYALAMTYAGKQLTLRDLVRDAKPAVGRLLATELLIFYPASIVYILALVALVIMWGRVGSQILLRGLIVAAGVTGWVLLFWTVAMWMVVSTVTVVEERWGVAAVKRGAEVARGRMWTAVAIMVTTGGVSFLSAMVQYVLNKVIVGEMGVWEVGVRAVFYMVTKAIQFEMQGAFAVFYYDWKNRGEGEQAKMMVEKAGFYAKLPTADVV